MKYTPEYIEYVREYPFKVMEDFRNGIKNEIVFTNKPDAISYIERMKLKTKRAIFTLKENRLDPEYI